MNRKALFMSVAVVWTIIAAATAIVVKIIATLGVA